MVFAWCSTPRASLLVYTAINGGFLAAVGGLRGPMLRSIIGCPDPVTTTVRLINGTNVTLSSNAFNGLVRGAEHCGVTGELFSGSAYCSDKNFVIDEAQWLSSWLTAMARIVSVCWKPVVYSFADRHSRIAVLVWSAIVSVAGTLFFAGASESAKAAASEWSTGVIAPMELIVLGYVMFGLRAGGSILNSYVASLSAPELRGKAFIVLFVMHGLAGLVGAGSTYLITKPNPTHYAPYLFGYSPSFLCTALLLIGLWSVPRPPPPENEVRGVLSLCTSALAGLREYFKLLCSSRILLELCATFFLLFFGGNGILEILGSFTLSVYCWNQATIIPVFASAVPFVLVGFAVFHRFFPTRGPAFVIVLLLPLPAIAVLLLLFAPWTWGVLPAAACIAAPCIAVYPAYLSFLTLHFPPEKHAQTQGVIEVAIGAGGTTGMLVFGRTFEASARGTDAMRPFAMGAATILPGIALGVYTAWRERNTVLPGKEAGKQAGQAAPPARPQEIETSAAADESSAPQGEASPARSPGAALAA